MDSKVITLEQAAGLVHDGMCLAMGGNTLHRAPMAFLRELARQGRRGLRLIKTAGAHDIDLLCAYGCVASVDAGFVSYETQHGLALHYRRAVEKGEVVANEHACYTVISGLRAAAAGIPFMPVRGLVVSDLLRVNPAFSVLEDPFGSGPVAVVRALRPDVAVLHVHRCDRQGNAIIDGPRFEDELLARAATRVILTTESILPENSREICPERVHIPGFLVEAVVHVPKGAAPGACYGLYEPDSKQLKTFLALKEQGQLHDYLASWENADRKKERGWARG